MNKQMLTVAAALLFTALAPAPSQAQQLTQAKVPFAFQAADTMMPAGEYQIRQASNTVQQIQRTDSSAAAFVITHSADSRRNDSTSRLIFHCYGNECFLSEIWNGNGKALKLAVSHRERELSQARTENGLALVSVPLTVTP